MDCTQQAINIYEICVKNAKLGNTLTYRDVLDYLGYGKRVQGHSIRYGLELAWIACAYSKLPILTSIVVNQGTGAPNANGYAVADWEKDAQKVFSQKEWPHVDDIDWDYVYKHRMELSNIHGTRGYWSKK
jgi:hypothetical protein